MVPLNISDKPSSKNNHANVDWAVTGSLKPLKPKACAFYLDKAELILELLRKQTPNNVLNVEFFKVQRDKISSFCAAVEYKRMQISYDYEICN